MPDKKTAPVGAGAEQTPRGGGAHRMTDARANHNGIAQPEKVTTHQRENDPRVMLEAATAYAARGWCVFPMAARNRVRARGVIDAAAEARTAGRAEASIADLFRAAGVRVTPARKGARVPRFEVLKQLMAAGEFFVAERCRYWLATVPSLPRDPRNPEDVDTSANDHALDATSYLIAGATAGRVVMGDFGQTPARLPDTGGRVMWV